MSETIVFTALHSVKSLIRSGAIWVSIIQLEPWFRSTVILFACHRISNVSKLNNFSRLKIQKDHENIQISFSCPWQSFLSVTIFWYQMVLSHTITRKFDVLNVLTKAFRLHKEFVTPKVFECYYLQQSTSPKLEEELTFCMRSIVVFLCHFNYISIQYTLRCYRICHIGFMDWIPSF